MNDPYSPPQSINDIQAGDASLSIGIEPTQGRPKGVTVTAVLSLLYGMLMAFGSLMTIAQSLLSAQFAAAFAQPGNAGNLQAEMQAAMNEVAARYQFVNLLLGGLGVVLGACLFAGAIGLLLKKEWSRTFLRRVFVGVIVLELSWLVIYAMTQLDMSPIMSEYMEKIAGAQGQKGAEAIAIGMKIGMVIGFAFYAVWLAVKLGLVVWGHRYLKKPHVVEYFERQEVRYE